MSLDFFKDESYCEYKQRKIIKLWEELKYIYNNRNKKYKFGNRKLWASFKIEDIRRLKENKILITNSEFLAFYLKSNNIIFIDNFVVSKLFSVQYSELLHHRNSVINRLNNIKLKFPEIEKMEIQELSCFLESNYYRD